MAKGRSIPNLTRAMKADLERLQGQPDEAIKTDGPEDADRSAKSSWVRGKFYRPIKTPISAQRGFPLSRE